MFSGMLHIIDCYMLTDVPEQLAAFPYTEIC